jgi:hypothetical protein
MSSRGSSIGCGPRLIKWRSLVRIPSSPSCVDMSKKKKKIKSNQMHFTFDYLFIFLYIIEILFIQEKEIKMNKKLLERATLF